MSMTSAVCYRPAPSTTQALFALGGRSLFAAMRSAVDTREQQIKALLARELPHGCRRVIAEILDTRPERISREFSHEEGTESKLSFGVLTVAIEILRIEGKGAVADQIVKLRDAGVSLLLDVRQIAFRQDTDGSLRWVIKR